MLIEGSGYSYSQYEKPFIEYFKRCNGTNMSIQDIEKQLPFLEKYYKEMVIEKTNYADDWYREITLKRLFKDWSGSLQGSEYAPKNIKLFY